MNTTLQNFPKAELTSKVIERVYQKVLTDRRPFNPLNPEESRPLDPQVQDQYLQTRRDEHTQQLQRDLQRIKSAQRNWQR